MNERIRELAEQAWDDTAIGDDGHPVSFAEKFAESIVRECIAQCDDLNSMKYIADHFGIKIEGLNDGV